MHVADINAFKRWRTQWWDLLHRRIKETSPVGCAGPEVLSACGCSSHGSRPWIWCLVGPVAIHWLGQSFPRHLRPMLLPPQGPLPQRLQLPPGFDELVIFHVQLLDELCESCEFRFRRNLETTDHWQDVLSNCSLRLLFELNSKASTATMTTRSESARARRRAMAGPTWRPLSLMPVPWAPCLPRHMDIWGHWCHHHWAWGVTHCLPIRKVTWHLPALQVFLPSLHLGIMANPWRPHQISCPWPRTHWPRPQPGKTMCAAWKKRTATSAACWSNISGLEPPFLPPWFRATASHPWKGCPTWTWLLSLPNLIWSLLCHLVLFHFVPRAGMPPETFRRGLWQVWGCDPRCLNAVMPSLQWIVHTSGLYRPPVAPSLLGSDHIRPKSTCPKGELVSQRIGDGRWCPEWASHREIRQRREVHWRPKYA